MQMGVIRVMVNNLFLKKFSTIFMGNEKKTVKKLIVFSFFSHKNFL